MPKLFLRQPKIEAYLALNDPHSYLLVRALKKIETNYRVSIALYLVYDTVPGVTIFPSLMNQWALKDANVLAAKLNLPIIKAYPSEQALTTGQQYWQLRVHSIDDAIQLFEDTWNDNFEGYCFPSTPVINFQVNNQKRLIEKGHYLSASVLFAGEWYLGVDRLSYLEVRLRDLSTNSGGFSRQFELSAPPCQYAPANSLKISEPIDVYLSLRSPYSYLGFVKAKRISQAYGVPLNLKPVMPLLMRGLKVPLSKQKYIYLDANREAQRAGIPFGSFTDPLGKGVMNCYQVFAFAQHCGKDETFIENAFRAIYVDGSDVSNENVIRSLCERAGFDYQDAIDFQQSHDWQIWSEQNLKQLAELKLWGVPCFKFKDTFCWGQDRLFVIEQALQEHLKYENETVNQRALSL